MGLLLAWFSCCFVLLAAFQREKPLILKYVDEDEEVPKRGHHLMPVRSKILNEVDERSVKTLPSRYQFSKKVSSEGRYFVEDDNEGSTVATTKHKSKHILYKKRKELSEDSINGASGYLDFLRSSSNYYHRQKPLKLVRKKAKALKGSKRLLIANPDLKEDHPDKDDAANVDEFSLLSAADSSNLFSTNNHNVQQPSMDEKIYETIEKLASVAKARKNGDKNPSAVKTFNEKPKSTAKTEIKRKRGKRGHRKRQKIMRKKPRSESSTKESSTKEKFRVNKKSHKPRLDDEKKVNNSRRESTKKIKEMKSKSANKTQEKFQNTENVSIHEDLFQQAQQPLKRNDDSSIEEDINANKQKKNDNDLKLKTLHGELEEIASGVFNRQPTSAINEGTRGAGNKLSSHNVAMVSGEPSVIINPSNIHFHEETSTYPKVQAIDEGSAVENVPQKHKISPAVFLKHQPQNESEGSAISTSSSLVSSKEEEEGSVMNKSSSFDLNKNNTKEIRDVLVGEDEPEECADDESSSDAQEENFVNGVKEINDLTKKVHLHGKKPSGPKETFASGIDISYLQDLFKGKDIAAFQENYTATMKQQVFNSIREKLNSSMVKIFSSFEQKDMATEMLMRKVVENKLKQQESSVRYDIDFPDFYHSVGTITLPYDDLVEPFESWYAGELNMSRIDYYYGMDKSYQRGDIGPHGVVVKLTPAHWSKSNDLDKNTISCWYKHETKWTKRRAQTVVPMNIKKFKLLGEEQFNGVPAYKFAYQKTFVSKNNTYIFHVAKVKPYKPLRYEMIGYDHLLRSHYDHYIIDYLSFEPWAFDYRVLQIPKEFKCYEQLRKLKSHFEANPMWDFLHGEEPKHRERELSQTYKDYKSKHKKTYEDHRENHKRKDIFRHNSRFVHSHNRAQKNYSLTLNHLADVSEDEFEMMKGQPNVDSPLMQKEVNAIPQLRLEIPKTPLPKNLDWRDYGAVSKVHSQSFCASCWAFSAAGAIESAYVIQNGSLEELAVQQLVDCSWGYENNGCRGGWSWRALKFVGDHGLATQASYGKYLAQEGYCHCGKKEKCNRVNKISFRTIQKHNAEKLKIALALYGPGSISVQCARKTFKFYSSGIYDDQKCTPKTDHAVVIVGYGEEKDVPYWIIKNSWGTLWGDEGYMKIDMKNNLCGVLQNGALMVSFNNWKDEKVFPFQRMRKIDRGKEGPSLVEKEREFLSAIDLYEVPNHVTSFMRMRKKLKL